MCLNVVYISIYCPGQVDDRDNESVDSLASIAPIIWTLTMGGTDVLRTTSDHLMRSEVTIGETARPRGSVWGLNVERVTRTTHWNRPHVYLGETRRLWACLECNDVYSLSQLQSQ